MSPPPKTIKMAAVIETLHILWFFFFQAEGLTETLQMVCWLHGIETVRPYGLQYLLLGRGGRCARLPPPGHSTF